MSLAEVALGEAPQRVRLELHAAIKGAQQTGLGHLEVWRLPH